MTTTQIEVPTAKLNTGAEIPLLGFGTYQIDQSAIEFALKVRLPRSPARIIIVCELTISFDFLQDGYKHFDTGAPCLRLYISL